MATMITISILTIQKLEWIPNFSFISAPNQRGKQDLTMLGIVPRDRSDDRSCLSLFRRLHKESLWLIKRDFTKSSLNLKVFVSCPPAGGLSVICVAMVLSAYISPAVVLSNGMV